MKRLNVGFAVAVFLLTASASRGEIIYHNGEPPEGIAAVTSDYSTAPHYDEPYQAADEFQLTQDAVLRGVHWWGHYTGGDDGDARDDFTIRLFRFDEVEGRATLDILLEVQDATVYRGPYADFHYTYDAPVPDFALEAGTRYILSVVNNTIGDDDVWGWLMHSYAAAPETYWWRTTDATPWQAVGWGEIAFYLTDVAPVPEPSSLCQLTAMLLMAGTLFRSRRGAWRTRRS